MASLYRRCKFVGVSAVRVYVAQSCRCSAVTEKMQQLVETLRVTYMETLSKSLVFTKTCYLRSITYSQN